MKEKEIRTSFVDVAEGRVHSDPGFGLLGDVFVEFGDGGLGRGQNFLGFFAHGGFLLVDPVEIEVLSHGLGGRVLLGLELFFDRHHLLGAELLRVPLEVDGLRLTRVLRLELANLRKNSLQLIQVRLLVIARHRHQRIQRRQTSDLTPETTSRTTPRQPSRHSQHHLVFHVDN